MGGSIDTLTGIDPDKLSFFEIQDLCHLVGAPKEHSRYRYLLPEGDLEHDLWVIETNPDVVNMTTLHRTWLADKIIIYIDIYVKPLAVEHSDGGGVANDGVGGDGGGVAEISGDVGDVGGDGGVDKIDLKSDYDVVLEEEEDVENDEEEDVENVEVGARAKEQDVEVGARVEEQNVEGDDDDDWLYKGLEGEDFGDEIFAAPNLAPQGFALESSDAPNIAPESSNTAL